MHGFETILPIIAICPIDLPAFFVELINVSNEAFIKDLSAVRCVRSIHLLQVCFHPVFSKAA